MHTEHLSNLHPAWVVVGWLTAAAVTSAVYVAGVGTGLAAPGSTAVVWVAVSMAGGFFAGGLVVGWRWSDAPILHGTAITLLSIGIWFVGGLLGGALGSTGAPETLGLVLIQFVASVLGGVAGRRWTLRSGADS